MSRSENGIKVVMSPAMIAASLLTLYKKLNNLMGWVVAKIQFLDELYVDITQAWRYELASAFNPANLNSG